MSSKQKPVTAGLNIPGLEEEPAQQPQKPEKAVTSDGHDFFEALSALQKSVRRGLELDALYWAQQVNSLNPTALWNRLKVFASEEVGVASETLPILIWVLADNALKQKEPGEHRLFYTHAVLALVRAKKSNVAHGAAICLGHGLFAKREVPDYALDKHTHRGKIMGRGMEHFLDVGALHENTDTTVPDPHNYWETARKKLVQQKEPSNA